MSVLGLLSCPAFAATTTTPAPTPTHHKKVHHHHHHHNVVVTHYTEAEVIPAHTVPVAVETEPKVDIFQSILDNMDHNTGRAKPMPDWFNRIGVSGGVNADVKWGNRRIFYTTENVKLLAINDAYVNFSATVNDWAKAFASLNFANPSTNYSYATPTSNNTINLEQGYVTLGNLDVYPVFLQVGKQFQDFGRYTLHPLNRTLAQSLSESLQTSVDLGFITRMGLHGSVYVFSNPATVGNPGGQTGNVYGAALGFDRPGDQVGFDVGVGYMSNMSGVGDVNNFLSTNMVHLVGAIAAYGDVNSGPFTLGARYSTAIQSFSPTDINTSLGLPLGTGSGARPWAADITGGYSYNLWAKNQNIYLGYQATNNAARLMLPKYRILAGLGVDMWKNTTVGLEYTHDNAYSSGNGGSGNSSNTLGLRAALKFG